MGPIGPMGALNGKRSRGESRLSRRFFARDAETMARALLGCRLVRLLEGGQGGLVRLSGIIVETEAYVGVEDAAAHSFGGRRTPRNEAMYGPPGTLYVYFTYGMHYCCNAICGKEGEPVGVLLRAIEPVEGIEFMREHREAAAAKQGSGRRTSAGPNGAGNGKGTRAALKGGTTCIGSGPARLTQALRIDRAFNGIDLPTDPRLFIERPPCPALPISDDLVGRGPRIGVDYAGEWAAAPLRFFIAGNPHVSKAKASGKGGMPTRYSART